MGGLATSTLLTLLVIPVGLVLFARLDRIFGRLGPWILMGWAAATTAVIAPLVVTGQLTSMTWQIVTTMLVAGAFLWLVAGDVSAASRGSHSILARWRSKRVLSRRSTACRDR